MPAKGTQKPTGKKKAGPGRGHEHVPTEDQRRMVAALVVAGAPQDRIARCVGINRETLEKHYREELDTSEDKLAAMCAGKLGTAIREGEAWAICFFLKCRRGWRERSEVEFSGGLELRSVSTLAQLAGEVTKEIREKACRKA